MPVDEGQKRNRSKIGRILLNGEFLTPGEETLFRNYYNRYEFPRWSLPENRANLAGFPVGRYKTIDYRRDLRNDLRRCGTGERPRKVHDGLNALALDYMNFLVTNGSSKKVKKDFHPATRVNAALMIGELNKKESEQALPPVPLPEALVELVKVVYNKKNPDAVRVAAMVGVIRHAKLSAIPSGNTRKVLVNVLASPKPEMLGVLNAPKPDGKAAVGDAWLRAQAAEVLEHLRDVGPDNAVIVALARSVSDKELPLDTRAAAAKALGKLNYETALRMESAPQVVVALCQLAVDAADKELASEDGQTPFSPARLKERLIAAGLGLKGFSAIPGAPRDIADRQQVIVAMVRIIEKNEDDTVTMKEIKIGLEKLRRFLPGQSKPQKPPSKAVPKKTEAPPPPPPPPTP